MWQFLVGLIGGYIVGKNSNDPVVDKETVQNKKESGSVFIFFTFILFFVLGSILILKELGIIQRYGNVLLAILLVPAVIAAAKARFEMLFFLAIIFGIVSGVMS
jgi:hypothetical protein